MTPRAKTAADLESHSLAGEADFHQLEPFLLGVSDFVARHLPSELVIKNRSASKSRKKLISDPIVGYVRLDPLEAECARHTAVPASAPNHPAEFR